MGVIETPAFVASGLCLDAPENFPIETLQFPHRDALYQGEKRLGAPCPFGLLLVPFSVTVS